MLSLQELPWDSHTPSAQLQQLYQQLRDNYENKLWHQFTTDVTSFYESQETVPVRLAFYKQVLLPIIDRINEIDVVQFLTQSLAGVDFDTALNELNLLKTKFIKIDNEKTRNDGLRNHVEACALIDLQLANIYLLNGDLPVARDILNKFELQFINVNYSPLSIVTSTFYEVNSFYYKLKKDYNSFYYNSLLYLSSLDPNSSNNSNITLDFVIDIFVAAILGDKIFNFGEILNNNKLTDTISSNNQDKTLNWIISLLNCLTCGDFTNFNNLINNKSQETTDQINLFVQNENFLRQKICIMTLIEIVFTKNIRILSFNDVATATHLNENDVEHLVMKAISLGLLKGSIDQVNQLITITWVQPRIINNNQIEKMNKRLIDWNLQVTKLAEKMEKRGKAIWV